MLLSILLFFLKRPASTTKWTQAAVCALPGILVLFHFETTALLTFVALNEVPRESLYAGTTLIIVGLCFSNELTRLGRKVSVPSTK